VNVPDELRAMVTPCYDVGMESFKTCNCLGIEAKGLCKVHYEQMQIEAVESGWPRPKWYLTLRENQAGKWREFYYAEPLRGLDV
jgi:hypothetical protein